MKKIFNNKPFYLHNLTYEQRQSLAGVSKQEKKKYSRWDSHLEYSIYQILLQYFSEKEIVRQHKIVILDECNELPAITWSVDFFIDASKPLYVEAKGQWLLNHTAEKRNFLMLMRVLKKEKPDVYSNLILAGDSEWTVNKLSIASKRMLHGLLGTLNSG